MLLTQRVQGLAKPDEVAGDQSRSLMDQLIKGMLPIRARLAPVNGAGVIVNGCPLHSHMLTVALHRQLLEVGGETL
jgi:hypothetical protein